MDYNLSAENDKDVTIGAFSSRFLKVQPLFNVTAEAGKKTLVWHWPGSAWPPSSDNPNLMVVDGTSPGSVNMAVATVDAEITNNIDSVMNPSGGTITADHIGELILEKDKVDPQKTKIICRG